MKCTVTAERGSRPGVWVFQCVEYPGAISQSRRLSEAVALMREAISFVAEVDQQEVEVIVRVSLPKDLAAEVSQARAAVRDLAQRQRETAALSRQVARDLKEAGLTGTDISTVLEVSPQRVSQLLHA